MMISVPTWHHVAGGPHILVGLSNVALVWQWSLLIWHGQTVDMAGPTANVVVTWYGLITDVEVGLCKRGSGIPTDMGAKI